MKESQCDDRELRWRAIPAPVRPPPGPRPPRPARPPASVAPVHDHILHVFSSCKEGPGDLPLGARRGGLTPPFDAAAAPDQRVLSQKMAEKPPMPGWRGNYLAARRPREASEPRLHRRLQEKDKQVLASGEASPTRRKMPARHLNSDGPFYPRSRRPPFGPRARRPPTSSSRPPDATSDKPTPLRNERQKSK